MKRKIPNLLYSKLMDRLVPLEAFSSNIKNNRTKKKEKKQLFIVSLLSQHQDHYF